MIKSSALVIFSLTIAYIIMQLPLPAAIALFRPELPLLVYLYWVIAMPQYHGILTGACVGLAQDFLTGAVLGTNALAYSVICTAFLVFYQQIRMQTSRQQALIILPLFFLLHAFQGLISGLVVAKGMPNLPLILFPAISAAVVWPWLMASLRSLRRRFNLVNRLI